MIKDLLTSLVSKSYLFFLGEGDGGIKDGSISGTALIKLTGSVPPMKAGAGNEPPVTDVKPPIPFKD